MVKNKLLLKTDVDRGSEINPRNPVIMDIINKPLSVTILDIDTVISPWGGTILNQHTVDTVRIDTHRIHMVMLVV